MDKGVWTSLLHVLSSAKFINKADVGGLERGVEGGRERGEGGRGRKREGWKYNTQY